MVTIPGPRENDADDVSLALEVAQSQWAQGDRAEALKWLKKAVDAAFEADDDKRGMELSKVAAEVKALADKPDKPEMPAPRGAAPVRPSTRRRTKSSVRPKPPVEEDEATREYSLADMDGQETGATGATIADEWPTETLEDIEDLQEVPAETASAGKSRSKSGQRSLKQKAKKPEPAKPARTPGQASRTPGKAKREEPEQSVAATRAIRVAVGRDKGVVYVRPLDAQGLRSGEHDAMLVALTSEGDIRTLFKG